MSPVSTVFALFVSVGLLAYYVFPKRLRWTVLLALSLIFYASGGAYLLLYLGFTAATTYAAGLMIDREIRREKSSDEDKKRTKARKKRIVGAALFLNFGLLFILKYACPILSSIGAADFSIVLPLGISFYIFQSASYVIDVGRGKTECQRSFAKYLLFVCFFPQMIQGPIGRYDSLSPYLLDGNDFDLDNFREGAKLITRGLVKKLVIADRASVAACAVIDSYGDFGGAELAVGVLFYCIQLYMDFSGGIDLMRGTARLFGVVMAENFRRPLFAVSLTDFWRRWHITLGAWMKDYLFYPITLSKPFAAIGRFTRKHVKGRAGKILPTSFATFLIYFVIGIWHGANFKYIIFGLWNGVLITAALLCEPFFVKVKERLHITNGTSYRVFCIARTAFLVFLGRYITRAASVHDAFSMMAKTFTDFDITSLFASFPEAYVLAVFDIGVVFVMTAVVVVLEMFEENGEPLSERIEKKGALPTFVFMTASAAIVVFLGIYRSGYISPEFIYKQF